MLIAVLTLFVVSGLGLACFQVYKRCWLEVARYVVSTAVGVAGYASILLHRSWPGFVALPVGVIGSVGYIVLAKAQARKAEASESP